MPNIFSKSILLFMLTVLAGNALLLFLPAWPIGSTGEFFIVTSAMVIFGSPIIVPCMFFYWVMGTFKPFPPLNYFLGAAFGLVLSTTLTLMAELFVQEAVWAFTWPFIVAATLSALGIELLFIRASRSGR
ncbi:MAG: hypothetical protein CMI36_03065 [Owenweeksia sp.]|nr:hypothetical protein [Owenweeksia sp.]MBF97949.1 hypothetical protein [Owenweeksia sp.]HBF18532.1 hypothetical protein [Cryomorphaceae bacterium]HCQ14915.1 hypothetical protein [Cryomorphaceae bacterium]|tara:strand:- start:189 stop:578 length:390 start_codon:yes stop_codon:yes gene_type:complete